MKGRFPGPTKPVGIVLLAAVVVASIAALAQPHGAPAAESSLQTQVAALRQQVATLQASVTALKSQSKTLKTQVGFVHDQLGLNFEGDTCLAAQTADLLQGTWGVIDQISQPLQNKTYFGGQTMVNDYGNCADMVQPTVARSGIAVPPTITPLLPLMQWMHE